MRKLTPTMLEGLRRMEIKLRSRSAVMAEPNENTGKALAARGLIELTDSHGGWNHYRLTDAGTEVLREHETKDA